MRHASMLQALVRQLRKKDLEWMAGHYCSHGHNYLEHPRCFIRDRDNNKLPTDCDVAEKIGFFDIEASELVADYGYVFSYALKELDGPTIGRVLSSKEILSFDFDKYLMAQLCNDLRKFTRIVVHWGTDRKFDLPFVRSRTLKWGYEFPLYREIWVHDTWNMAKSKLRLRRNSLENIATFFDIPTKGHRLVAPILMKARAGDQKSLDYIFIHNIEDVETLEAVWKKLNLYVPRGKASI